MQLSESGDLDAEARLHDVERIAETDTDMDVGRLGKADRAAASGDRPARAADRGRGNRSRSPDVPCVLYAAIIAQATNLGLTGWLARASSATSSNGRGSNTAASTQAWGSQGGGESQQFVPVGRDQLWADPAPGGRRHRSYSPGFSPAHAATRSLAPAGIREADPDQTSSSRG